MAEPSIPCSGEANAQYWWDSGHLDLSASSVLPEAFSGTWEGLTFMALTDLVVNPLHLFGVRCSQDLVELLKFPNRNLESGMGFFPLKTSVVLKQK